MSQVSNTVPIYTKTWNGKVFTGELLQLSEEIFYDYAILFKKEDEIYKCFRNDIWICCFCKKCSTFLCRDYSTISNHCLRKHRKKDEIEKFTQKNILKFVILNNQYLSIVENSDFKALFPFEIISKKKISDILNIFYDEVKSKIKKELAKHDYMTIYFDEWSKFQHNFLGITVSTSNSIFLLDLIVPDDIERTREVISHYIQLTLNYYQISTKISFQCSDCGSNVLSVCQDIDWFPCCNHILNRCIYDCLEFIPKANELAIRLSSLRYSQKFKRYLLLHSLKFTSFPNYCPTRWYSLADLFSRAKDCREIIEGFQKYLSKNGKNSLKKGVEFLTLNDFCLIDAFSEFFNGIKYSMMDLEKDSPESIFWAMSNIATIYFNHCDILVSYGFEDAAKAFREGFIKRCIKYEKHHFLFNLLIGGFLNPHINFQQILLPEEDLPNEYKNLETKFMNYLQFIAPGAFQRINNLNNRTFVRRGQTVEIGYQNEIEKLKTLNKGDESDLIKWWELNMNKMPVLYDIVKKMVTLRPTSASIERVFSKGKYLLDDFTGAMEKENMAKRIFLYCNGEITRKVIEEKENI